MREFNLDNIIDGIEPINKEVCEDAKKHIDSLLKPLGSLGRLEELAIRLSGITGKVHNEFKRKATIVMCADNGVVVEGISGSPKEITVIQTLNILNGVAGINVLSKEANSDVVVVDIGIDGEIEHSKLIDRKIRSGTDNIAKGKAMSKAEALQAIEIGFNLTKDLITLKDYSILGTGEMGIGNTTTSSAIVKCLFNSDDSVVGKGGGLTESGLERKKAIINRALSVNKPNREDAIDIVSKIGGFDIAGLIGCFLAAAYYKVPIVVDGVISIVSALLAYKLDPRIKEYLIASHKSVEPAYRIVSEHLGLEPYLYMDMRLGEGTGCPLAFQLIDMSMAVVNNMMKFEDIKIDDDYLIDIR